MADTFEAAVREMKSSRTEATRRRRSKVHAMSFELPPEMRLQVQRRALEEGVSAATIVRGYVEFGLRHDERVARKRSS
jgi:hypothetical protein